MSIYRPSRRALIAGAGALAVAPRTGFAQARKTIRIGVMGDQSGAYRDTTGPTLVACVRQAVLEFGDRGFNVDVIVADHQNKPDIAVTLTRQWLDRDGVDVITDGGASSCALAMNTICREKNKLFLNTTTATAELTGKSCSPNTIHWTYDTYMLSKSNAQATVKSGGKKWFFISANYEFGQQLQRDTAEFVRRAGGSVVGSVSYPFPQTTDFSSYLLQAQSSGADVLAFCNAGDDLGNCIKQAKEFQIDKTMRIAAMLMYVTDVRALGLDNCHGLQMCEPYYWDLNDRTRAFMERIKPKVTLWPNSVQAGSYSAVLHYLKAVADMGVDAAKMSGADAVARMKAMPTDDDAYGKGSIREDGRKLHPSYLFRAKRKEDSRHQWDVFDLVAETPPEEAFRPLAEGGCPLIRS
jgi:branched-chain amino acid transport system substrate-binding protein